MTRLQRAFFRAAHPHPRAQKGKEVDLSWPEIFGVAPLPWAADGAAANDTIGRLFALGKLDEGPR